MFQMVRLATVISARLAVAVGALFASVHAAAQPSPDVMAAEPPISPALHRDADIYGWQLMTHQERSEFLARLDAARTAEERRMLRLRNHKAMDTRARERGVVLSALSKADEDPRRHPGAVRENATACVDAAK
jgi:predicted Fe-S protein YdhL (DUF1289 family)